MSDDPNIFGNDAAERVILQLDKPDALRDRLITEARKRDVEFVMPSGAFARMRAVTALDFLIAKGVTEKHPNLSLAGVMLTRCLTIDGEKPTYAALMALDVRDWLELDKRILPMLKGPVTQ